MALVANSRMRVPEGLGVHLALVDQGPDAADDWIVENVRPGGIVENVRPGDVVATADIPLAARSLEAGAGCWAPTAGSDRLFGSSADFLNRVER